MKYLELGIKEEGFDYIDRVGAYGIIIKNNQIAIMKKNDGAYFLPGGGVEGQETLEECLRREMLEETGYEIEIEGYIGVCSVYDFSRNKKYHIKGIGHFYKVEFLDRVCDPIEEREKMIWVDIEDAKENMHLENQKWAIEKVCSV